MSNKIDKSFQEIKLFVRDFFKEPSSVVDQAVNASSSTGYILILGTLIMTAMTTLLWNVKTGSIFNLILNSTAVLSAIGSQVISYGLIAIILYLMAKNKNDRDILGMLTIASVAYFPAAVFRFLANIVNIIGITSVISISGALATAGIVAFGILIYNILKEKGFNSDKEAFFITILICFFV